DPADQVGRTTHEIPRGTQVAPVRLVHVPKHTRPAVQQLREDLPLHGHRTALRDGLNDVPIKDVAARVDLVRRRILSLLQESLDTAGLVRRYTAESARIGHAQQVQGDLRVLLHVGAQDRAEVHAAQHVAGEALRPVVARLARDVADSTAGAQWLVHDDVLDL